MYLSVLTDGAAWPVLSRCGCMAVGTGAISQGVRAADERITQQVSRRWIHVLNSVLLALSAWRLSSQAC